jgi:hypothetical protein
MAREIETLLAVIAFAAVFLFGHRLGIHRKGWRRAGVSASAGAAVAYVFVHLLPDMEEAGRTFVEATAGQAWRASWLAESHVYLAALAGFVVFYGLEHLVAWSRRTAQSGESGGERESPVFLLHIGGFAVYGQMVSYLMVRGTGLAQASIALYAVAMGLHFLSVDHSLLREHAARYLRPGRYILATAVLAGWACGALLEIPRPIVCTLMGLVSGGVIMNSMIMELPAEKEGKVWPFVLGAALYAVIMLLATGIGAGSGE